MSVPRWVALWVTSVHAFRGNLDDARQWLATAEEALDRNEIQNVVGYHTLEAIVLLAEGRPAEALAVRRDFARAAKH